MTRIMVFAAVLMLFIGSGCSAATSSEAVGQVETALDIEPSPTPETLPDSLRENQEALEEMGYTLQQSERGWELTSPQGQVVLKTSDTSTIQAFGANNEILISPEQSFGVTETIGAGMEKLLTLTDSEGNITHTFLERAGYWAPLAEIQRNPREIDNYPQVPIEDLWNGRLAQSEALTAEPFPEGALVPDGFVYFLTLSSQGYFIQIRDIVSGMDDTNRLYRMGLNEANDYRRWTNFYRSQTPDGVDIIIATEQILMPDGVTTLHLHHTIGGERPWAEEVISGGNRTDLRQNVFLSRVEPAPEGTFSHAMRPVVFTSEYNSPQQWGISFTREPNAGIGMYDLEQNNPANAQEGLETFFRSQYEVFNRSIPRGRIGDVGEEIVLFQYMGLASYGAHGIFEEEYFKTQ